MRPLLTFAALCALTGAAGAQRTTTTTVKHYPNGRVVVTDTVIEWLDEVRFVGRSDALAHTSLKTLDAVASTLQGNPSIRLVEIQGHTDERGDEADNLDLSDRRAHVVRNYLISRGVDPARLEAQGYGETQPLDRAHTTKAWAKNRRVAFLILTRTTD